MPNGNSIGLAVLQGTHTSGQTDHATPSVS